MFDDSALGVLRRALAEASPRDGDEKREDIHARMGPSMALALRLLMLTLTRRTEAAGAMWSEFDPRNRLWTIPAERSKSKRAHVVPLSEAAMEVLRLARVRVAIENPYVFPSPKDSGQHLDPHAVTRAVSRLCERHGLATGSPHDIRRSGATTLTREMYGVRRFVVGRVLGHNPQDGAAVTAVYDRNEYLADKRAALQLWAEHLQKCEDASSVRDVIAPKLEAWSVASVEDWVRAAS
jgi:integrase